MGEASGLCLQSAAKGGRVRDPKLGQLQDFQTVAAPVTAAVAAVAAVAAEGALEDGFSGGQWRSVPR